MMSFLVFYLNYLNRPNPNNKYKTSAAQVAADALNTSKQDHVADRDGESILNLQFKKKPFKYSLFCCCHT